MALEPITLLQEKRIILAVTGSIAVYKAVDLASKLTQHGAQVDVIMTGSAQQFVLPITFQSVTGRPVYNQLWQSDSQGGLPTHIAHVGLAEDADCIIVAPATANTMAKMAQGLADDLLSVTLLAARCPVLVAPAMDGSMYEHPATRANVDLLASRGVTIIEPEEGRFASGLVGKGRLPDTPTLIGHIRRTLGRTGTLSRRQVMVTAGGTREAIDPVRYITNHSSGKQGYALAQAALDAGANVILISTTNNLPVPVGASFVHVGSAEDMLDAMQKHMEGIDILLMAAAVSDFRPATASEHKIKKSQDKNELLTLELGRTPDILLEIKTTRESSQYPQLVVGFAAESRDLLENARAKLEKKDMDLIIANDISATDAGFGADTNRVTILDRDGGQQAIDLTSKTLISEAIIKRVAVILQHQFIEDLED
jgi:phosphopantothenoylcysteine decarboxylase/phosphopantothenate--cysteine ligase